MAYSLCPHRMSQILSRSTRSISFPAAKLFSRSVHAGNNGPRRQLLKEIYAPFAHLEKGSTEYNALATSGKCWSGYFNPENMDRYKELEKEHSNILDEIDSYRASINRSKAVALTKSLVPGYAHQSTSIENNHLPLKQALHIADCLSKFFQSNEFAALTSSDLISLPLPFTHELIPAQDPSQVAEVRNHIVASQWVTEAAFNQPGTTCLNEPQTRDLSALMIRDTNSETLYSSSWGGRTLPGEYRKTPIGVRSDPLRIFPYHLEVPNLIKEFFTWRDNAHNQIHPLLLACHIVVYFLAVHPFLDGNGRVSRTLMQDYLIRQGYFPIVMKDLERGEYLAMISDCQDGRLEGFVRRVLSAQLGVMKMQDSFVGDWI